MTSLKEHHSIGSSRLSKLWNVVFILFLVLIVYVRLNVFTQFSTKVIDSDQPYMWLGAKDYSEGQFMEPRYYGQDYNTFMEALFAAPLLWFKVPAYKAVPIATQIISLFPFFFIAIYLFFRKLKPQAICVLAVVLCLSISYDLISSLPRGFVTGVFFNSFFIVSVLNPNNLKMLTVNTLLAVLAYFVSPNSVMVSVPFLFYIFLSNYRNKTYYFISGICVLISIPVLYILFDRFYKLHPDYVLNDLTLRYSTDYFGLALSKLDTFFKHVSFFTDESSIPVFIVLLLFLILLWKSKSKFFYALLLFFPLLALSLCFGKTHDGSDWLFMSHSRMYLGIPILIALMIPLVKLNLPKYTYFLLCLPLVFGIYKSSQIEQAFKKNEPTELWTGVRLITMKEARNYLTIYKEACAKSNADFLLVSDKFWLRILLAYGGPAVFDDYPETMELRRDKRYWVREKNQDKVIPKFVIISSNFNLDKEMPQGSMLRIRRLDDYGLHLIEGNTYKTRHLVNLIAKYEN